MIVAVCGYAVYGDEVSDNALESYPSKMRLFLYYLIFIDIN